MAELFKWLEHHIILSLQPKLEDVKTFMSNSEYRIVTHGFLTNEQNRRLYVYIKPSKEIVASYLPSGKLYSKSLFFLKCHSNSIITKDNIDNEVQYFDCLPQPSHQLQLETREVYLPLLCNNSPLSKTLSYGEDKLLNVLHSLMYLADIGQGLYKGHVVLALPSLDVLLNAAADPKRFQALKYLLETTVLSWISETKTVLQHDAVADLFTNFGEEPTPDEEVRMWELHLAHLRSLLTQLDSPMAQYIIQSLKQVGSQYTNSIVYIKGEINKEIRESSTILSSFQPLWKWYKRFCQSTKLNKTLKLLKPLVTTLTLMWSHSVYYHQKSKFSVVVQILCNGIVKNASSMIGKNILSEPQQSYRELKKSLQICASFRGTYLDFKAEMDLINAKNVQDFNEKRPKEQDIREKLFGVSYGRAPEVRKDTSNLTEDDLLIQNSPWPHRNSTCFQTLNNFMERCNDILELVETAEHFQVLAGVAEVGGIGNIGIDLLVKDISATYTSAIDEFFSSITNVMDIKETKTFDFSFFKLRSTVKTLEVKLSNILYQALEECPSTQSKIRLLEVFQATCCRPQVQAALTDIIGSLVKEYWAEICQLENIFEMQQTDPPRHQNFSREASQIIWIHGLMNQTQILMSNMKDICSHVLKGDDGWKIKEHYEEVITKFTRYKSQATEKWLLRLEDHNASKLKETLLIAEDFDDTIQERPSNIYVTLSDDFLIVIHEMLYFCQEPFLICNHTNVENMVGDMSLPDLQVSVTKLQLIAFTYNYIMKTMKEVEKPLFEAKLLAIDQLIEQGTEKFTWKMKESSDFIESATSLVCTDIFHCLKILQANCNAILDITLSWNEYQTEFYLTQAPLSIEKLLEMKNYFLQSFSEMLVPSNNKIHSLLSLSAQVMNVSEASPSWQDYLCYVDFIVLAGLKKAIYSHLNILRKYVEKEESSHTPLLTVNVILLDRAVDFSPCLDQSTYYESAHEAIQKWIQDVFKESDLLTMLTGEQSYNEFLVRDAELQELVMKIDQGVENTVVECKKVSKTFEEYSHLWLEEGEDSPKEAVQDQEYSEVAGQNGYEEHWNLEPKKSPLSIYNERNESRQNSGNNLHQLTLKSLEIFDAEAEKYMNLKEKILTVPEYQDIGWIRMNQEPIKQTINAIVSKWLWTSTKTLVSQVTLSLQDLDQYMKGLEAEMEFVTSREKDILSFTRIMRLFNQVSSAHSRMEKVFALINKTVEFLKKYQHELSVDAGQLYQSNPIRWNNLKTKVSLAKQNLGPTIQEESPSILKELNAFNTRLSKFLKDISETPVTKQDCDPTCAANIISEFNSRQKTLETEAMDLKELEDLLEISVLKTDDLKQCQDLLIRIEDVWRAFRFINKNHSQWKTCLWQKINISFIKEETTKELEILEAIPKASQSWDIYKSIYDSVKTLKVCVSLIEDLRNPAMRTRHWRQLLRVTSAPVDSEFLNQLTLQQFLQLNFQSSIEDVQAIVKKAVKELVVEKAMKTCEEVWLSHIFHLEVRKLPSIEYDFKQQVDSRRSSQMHLPERDITPSTIRSSSATHDAPISLSTSRLSMFDGEVISITLLTDTETLFQELTHHQMTLNNLFQCQHTTSFNDEITKWQGQLLIVESIVILWLQVQEKWNQLIEAFALPDVQTLLSNETKKFFKANFQFCRLMKSVERNSNILQNCTKKWIRPFLESLLLVFEKCYKALLNHVEHYQVKFPRFYFVSPKEVLELVCYGKDPNKLNLHLRKLFHYIWDLQFKKSEDVIPVPTIMAILSETQEILPFQKPLMCDGPIEHWLVTLGPLIKESLSHQLCLAMNSTVASSSLFSSPEETNEKNIKNGNEQTEEKNFKSEIKQNSFFTKPESLEKLYGSWKWLSDIPTEIIILTSKIKFTEQILQAMEGNVKERERKLKILMLQKTKRNIQEKFLSLSFKFKHKTSLQEKIEECLANINSSLMEIPKILWNLQNLPSGNQELKAIKQTIKLSEGTEQVSHVSPLVVTQQVAKLETFLLNQSITSGLINQLLDLCKESNGHSEMDFTWKRQLQYLFDYESSQVTIKCFDWVFDYGFEYQGSAKREPITATTEKAFLGLFHALTNFKLGHCIGPLGGRKIEIIKELSFCLGKAVFFMNCSVNQDKLLLGDLLKGVTLTGDWLCLNNINHLKMDQLHFLAEELEKTFHSFKNTQISKTENGEPDKVRQHIGAIFSLQDSNFPIAPHDPDKLTLYPAVYATLPDKLLRQLRPVSCLRPCSHQAMGILLLSFGFTNIDKLSMQIKHFIEYMEKLHFMDKIFPIGSIDSTANVKNVSCSLTRLQTILHTAAKFFATYKFTESKNLLEEPEMLLQFEEKAVVRALWKFWLPLLKKTEVFFARKLIDHIWPESIQEASGILSSILTIHEEIIMPDPSANNHKMASTKSPSIHPWADNSYYNLDILIKAAVEDLKLGASSSFHAKIKQLYFLSQTHSMVLVVGPPGCGKSICIDTYVGIMKQKGFVTVVKNLFLKSQESYELMGYLDLETKEWVQGLLPNILENIGNESNEKDKARNSVNSLIRLDGKADAKQIQVLQELLTDIEMAEQGNCERVFFLKNLSFFWELEDMENLTPSFVSQVGIFQMTSSDIGWQVLWKMWLGSQPEKSREHLHLLAEKYLPHLMHCCQGNGKFSPVPMEVDNTLSSCKWMVKQTPDNAIHTLCSYWKALENSINPKSFKDYEYCFSFSCIWAFAGCLIRDHRKIFDSWWREIFSENQLFPDSGTVFDFRLECSEVLKFVPWTHQSSGDQFILQKKSSDLIPTEKTEQLSYLLGLLIDTQMPAMLIGTNGCGKTHILSEKLQCLSSGEMAETRSWFIHANRFTTAKSLQQKLSEHTEWKYGSIYMPKGGKRLYYCIDDINYSNADVYGDQSAVELVRQHMDLGGFYNYKSKKWQTVKDVVYMSTLNPNPTAYVPMLNPRLLRHFALLVSPYPDLHELKTLFRGILSQNLFPAKQLSHSSIIKNSNQNNEEDIKKLLETIIHCTVELHLKLQTMFLPTPQRSHYIFTLNGIKSVFQNLCLSIHPDNEPEEVLQLWHHECSWEFQQKMINEVDLHRYHIAFQAAVRKVFNNKTHIALLAENLDDVFSNIVETESGRVMTSTLSYQRSLREQPEGPDTDNYQPTKNLDSLRQLLNKGIEENNKNSPLLKIPLYKPSIKMICRYARVLSGNKPFRHYTVVTEGSPGTFSALLQLSAFLSGYTILQLCKCIPNQSQDEQISFFKNQFIGLCMKAGMKDEKLLLQICEEDVCCDDVLVLLLEFICYGHFTSLISSDQQTNIINTMRGEVHHAGQACSSQHAWQYFLQRVNANLHIFLIIGNSTRHYQRWCQQFPSLVKNTNFVWICHWTKKQLIQNAMYHVQDLTWMPQKQQENTCHLLCAMHMSLEKLSSKDGRILFKYCNNTTYQAFIQKFVDLAGFHYKSIMSDHKKTLDAYQYIQKVEQEVKHISHRIEHETLLMEQNQMSSKLLLHQIGQDSTIAKQQQNFVELQKKMIDRLRKLLPEYQVAHQRAVYKTVQIVTNTKKLLHKINLEDLAILRSMQKPALEVEDVLATVIIIVKSPSADLTWHKGAKRIMANIDRFVGELMTFDDYALPVSALDLVEEYISKPTFKPDHVTQVSENSACGILCQWVINVLRYHRIMSTRVKPLHEKVNGTIASISKAEDQLDALKDRSKELVKRIAKLSQNFEEASMSTRRHEIFLSNTEKDFASSAEVQQMMNYDKEMLTKAINLLDHRLEAVRGICAMAAGLVTYLGPCQHSLRQLVLSVMWPNFLKENGISLIYDHIHYHKGYIVEWSFDFLQEASSQYINTNAEEKFTSDLTTEIIPEEGDDEVEENASVFQHPDSPSVEQDKLKDKSAGDINSQVVTPQSLPEDKITESEFLNSVRDEKMAMSGDRKHEEEPSCEQEEQEQEDMDIEYLKEVNSWSGFEENKTNLQDWQPSLSAEDYKLYVHALVKTLVGEDLLSKWIREDVSVQHLENAAILWSNQNSNLFIIDPNQDGENWFEELTHYRQREAVEKLNLNHFDSNLRENLLKCMEQGKSVLLHNYSGFLDHNTEFLLHYEPTKDSNPIIKENCFDGGCFSLNNNFHLCITSPSEEICLPVGVGSLTTILNYGCYTNVLTESLLNRIFQKLHPSLSSELLQAHKSLETLQKHMRQVKNFMEVFMESTPPSENTVKDSISTLLKWYQIRVKESELQEGIDPVIKDLAEKKLEYQELATRATILYQLVYSFKYIHSNYHFPLSGFLNTLNEILVDEEQQLISTFDCVTEQGRAGAENELPTPYSPESTQNTDNQFQFPDLPILPTPGVDYTSLSANKIRHYIEALTYRILRQMQMCLHENDWLLFQTMFHLTIQTNDSGIASWEEFSLLVQGTPGISIQLTLQDFQCNDDPPSWLPSYCWDNVLALSVLNGPLDSLCVQLVENSQCWQLWFESEMPELEPFPPDDSSEYGVFSEFHQLLIIRNLRPDRFIRAMQIYLNKNGFYSLEPIKFSDILQAGFPYQGYLVSVPETIHEDPVPWLRQILTPQERLQKFAEENNICSKVINISMDGTTKPLDILKSEFQEGFTWIIINLMERFPKEFLQQLSHCLDNGSWNQSPIDENDPLSKPCLWLIHTLSDNLPESLHRHFLKVAWFHIDGIVVNAGNDSHHLPVPADYLWAAITKYLHETTQFIKEKSHEISPQQKLLIFGVTVMHSILCALQDFGCSSGIGQWYPIHQQILPWALEVVLQNSLSDKDKAGVFALLKSIRELFYNHFVFGMNDRLYVEMIFNQILHSLVYNPTKDIIIFGAYQIPVPPANIDVSDYAIWFKKKWLKSEIPDSVSVLQIPPRVTKNVDTLRNKKFFTLMNTVYERQTMDDSSPSQFPGTVVEAKLQSALELCIDELPPLLDSNHLNFDICDLPQSPCEEEMAAGNNLTFKYVMIQECSCYNLLMERVYKDVNELKAKLVQGISTIDVRQLATTKSLQRFQVPVAWLHQGWIASCHTLSSWIEGSKRQYQQLKTLCEQFSLVASPLYQGGLSLWLGGMSNAIACITALKLDTALTQKCPLNKMSLKLVILEPRTAANQPSPFLFHDIYLSGASWDYKQNCLVKSLNQVHHFSTMVLQIKKHQEEEDDTMPEENIYNCPIYTNPSRLVCVCTGQILCPSPVKEWMHTQVAIFLNPGNLDEDFYPATYTEIGMIIAKGTRSRSCRLTEDGNNDQQVEIFETDPSEPSQRSYRVLTPKADPLPSSLRLVKEAAFDITDPDQEKAGMMIAKSDQDGKAFPVDSPKSRSSNVKLSTSKRPGTDDYSKSVSSEKGSRQEEFLQITPRQKTSTFSSKECPIEANKSESSSEYLGGSEQSFSGEVISKSNIPEVDNSENFLQTDNDGVRLDRTEKISNDCDGRERDLGVGINEDFNGFGENKKKVSTLGISKMSETSKSFVETIGTDSDSKDRDSLEETDAGHLEIKNEEGKEEKEKSNERTEEEEMEEESEGGKGRIRGSKGNKSVEKEEVGNEKISEDELGIRAKESETKEEENESKMIEREGRDRENVGESEEDTIKYEKRKIEDKASERSGYSSVSSNEKKTEKLCEDEKKEQNEKEEEERSKRGEEEERSKRGEEEERSKRGEEDERSKRGEEDERSKRGEEDERSKRGEEDERSKRGEEDERSKRGEEDERSKRGEEDERSKRGEEDERSKRGEEDERSKRGEEDERSKRGEEDERSKRGEEDERSKRGEEDERSKRGEEDERSKRGEEDERSKRGEEEEERSKRGEEEEERSKRGEEEEERSKRGEEEEERSKRGEEEEERSKRGEEEEERSKRGEEEEERSKRGEEEEERSKRGEEEEERSKRGEEEEERSKRGEEEEERSKRGEEEEERSKRGEEEEERSKRGEEEEERSKRGEEEEERSKRGEEDERSKRGEEDERSKRGEEDERSKRGEVGEEEGTKSENMMFF